MDDREIISNYQSGDRKVISHLIERYHQSFCSKAYWILKDKDQSKDVVQESWMVIMDKLHGLRNPDAFSFWAMRIVSNKCMDLLNQNNVQRLNEHTLKNEVEEHSIDDKQEALKLAIEQLTVEKQHVIQLFYVQQYAVSDIAEILNISQGTVKSRLFNARKKLKTILKN
ncbi:RNA polymerase sigma factor [Nonlabens xiamenensis]|uniref:RNA polymerase sigma factor n=1 Tax=Nonlabens xiamenensis TaxID=2341043 RepID=UPI000F60DAC9|nr:sigma-70 family RNA polymerase sigma factor [Nonlabens xiamenensis]